MFYVIPNCRLDIVKSGGKGRYEKPHFIFNSDLSGLLYPVTKIWPAVG